MASVGELVGTRVIRTREKKDAERTGTGVDKNEKGEKQKEEVSVQEQMWTRERERILYYTRIQI